MRHSSEPNLPIRVRLTCPALMEKVGLELRKLPCHVGSTATTLGSKVNGWACQCGVTGITREFDVRPVGSFSIDGG